jgi:Mg/Co/Ni transporter MgtE
MESQRVSAPPKPAFVLVSDVMRPAVTVRATATLREVAYAMLELEAEAVAVIDGRGNVCGAITAADLTVSDGTSLLAGVENPRMHGLWFAPQDLLESAAATSMVRRSAGFMRTGFTTARPGEYLSAVVQRLMKHGTQQAFVEENGCLLGMICVRDLLRVLAAGPTSFVARVRGPSGC